MEETITTDVAQIKAVLYGANGASGITQQIKDLQQTQTTNRDDLYDSIETVKRRVTEIELNVTAIKTTMQTLKWMLGVGFSISSLLLVLIGML